MLMLSIPTHPTPIPDASRASALNLQNEKEKKKTPGELETVSLEICIVASGLWPWKYQPPPKMHRSQVG